MSVPKSSYNSHWMFIVLFNHSPPNGNKTSNVERSWTILGLESVSAFKPSKIYEELFKSLQ